MGYSSIARGRKQPDARKTYTRVVEITVTYRYLLANFFRASIPATRALNTNDS
ncbi:Uncharacterised protein [Pseudomonas putida]|jgi:hypothetical protein|nr:hypothetical protein SAMN05216307_0581 [Pseudomonas putida]SMQ03906.1 hypothetical protein SAMN05216380_4894 [Pseudomonas putida]VEE42630.1 Uncharacterised protein [Pseudomonas putida]VTQ27900.1 Uncharacterised protein [Pseudomonas putida]